MAEPLRINIRIADMKPFESLIKCVGELVIDERIPLRIRNEIVDKLEKIKEVEK